MVYSKTSMKPGSGGRDEATGRDGALQRYREKRDLRRLKGSSAGKRKCREGSQNALKTLVAVVKSGRMCDDSGVDNEASETLEQWRRGSLKKHSLVPPGSATVEANKSQELQVNPVQQVESNPERTVQNHTGHCETRAELSQFGQQLPS
mmetsp:Transcript_217/g.687  ORF Transcript_217/g.687 Transcript_217/m.687 type:complete len:149 (+) Transcript_217:277-723(+)